MQCLYVAKNMTKCPLMSGVHLREVSVCGGSTVVTNEKKYEPVVMVPVTVLVLNAFTD